MDMFCVNSPHPLHSSPCSDPPVYSSSPDIFTPQCPHINVLELFLTYKYEKSMSVKLLLADQCVYQRSNIKVVWSEICRRRLCMLPMASQG